MINEMTALRGQVIRRRPITVRTVQQAGKVAYQFKCDDCNMEPMFGKQFRKHLVGVHGMRDRTALNLIAKVARKYKNRNEL